MPDGSKSPAPSLRSDGLRAATEEDRQRRNRASEDKTRGIATPYQEAAARVQGTSRDTT